MYLTFFDESQLWNGDPVATATQAARRLTDTPGDSIGAYLAWSGDRLGVAWSDNSDDAYQIYLETFDTSGHSLNPATQLTRSRAQSMIPDIHGWHQGFLLSWGEVVFNGHSDHTGNNSGQSTSSIMMLKAQ